MDDSPGPWLDSPLVKQAILNAGGAVDAARVMDELASMMHQLEEMAPGVPFRELLACGTSGSAEGLAAAAQRLLEQGYDYDSIDEILDSKAWRQCREIVISNRVVEAYRQGLSNVQIADEVGIGRKAVARILRERGLRTSVFKDPNEVGAYAAAHGVRAAIQYFGYSYTANAHVTNLMKRYLQESAA